MSGKREELASIFKQPTTWGDYCKFVSPTNCTEDDGVAARPPRSSEEVDEAPIYFMDGEYTGYFRATEKNNCALNPQTCSGHVVQAHALGIPTLKLNYSGTIFHWKVTDLSSMMVMSTIR